jgi:hypothetical protein
VPIRPPARPSTAFFSDRVFASKMGKSTAAPATSMLGLSMTATAYTQYATRER